MKKIVDMKKLVILIIIIIFYLLVGSVVGLFETKVINTLSTEEKDALINLFQLKLNSEEEIISFQRRVYGGIDVYYLLVIDNIKDIEQFKINNSHIPNYEKMGIGIYPNQFLWPKNGYCCYYLGNKVYIGIYNKLYCFNSGISELFFKHSVSE